MGMSAVQLPEFGTADMVRALPECGDRYEAAQATIAEAFGASRDAFARASMRERDATSAHSVRTIARWEDTGGFWRHPQR